MKDVLKELTSVLEERKSSDPDDSYVASLYAKGMDKILEKVEEEAGEVMDAAKGGINKEIIHETADLWFHTLVMLAHAGLSAEDILNELGRRFGISGHEEKAARNK